MPLRKSPNPQVSTFYNDHTPRESTQHFNAGDDHASEGDIELPVQHHGSIQNDLVAGVPHETRPYIGLVADSTTSNDSQSPARSGRGIAGPQQQKSTQAPDQSLANHGRTHLSNITPVTFFASRGPRGQQERQSRPLTPPYGSSQSQTIREQTPPQDVERRRHMTRYSDASIITMDPDINTNPQTRGSTDGPRHLRSNRSQASIAPLRPSHLDPTKPIGPVAVRADRSPRSLRTSFGLNSRSSQSAERKDFGHRKLASEPSSPEMTNANAEKSKTNAERNYEYYNGNAMFFLRGRLLNARQRPLNALTAFLANLPTLLFFIFS